MAKQVLGYRLKEPQYTKAVAALLGYAYFEFMDNNFCVSVNSDSSKKLRDAGILDLWFEHVYEEDGVELEKNTWYYNKSDYGDLVFHTQNGEAWGWHNNKWKRSTDYFKDPSKDWRLAEWKFVQSRFKLEMESRNIELRSYIQYGGQARKVVKTLTNSESYIPKLTICDTLCNDFKTVPVVDDKGHWVEKSHIREGEWYLPLDNEKAITYFNGHEDHYGISYQGEWFTHETQGTLNLLDEPHQWARAYTSETIRRLKVYGCKEGFITTKDRVFFNTEHNVLKAKKPHHEDRYQKHHVVMEEGEWQHIRPALPEIKGYKGQWKADRKEITYGNDCAVLNAHWFLKSRTRSIERMELSSGVILDKDDIHAIRKFLESQNI